MTEKPKTFDLRGEYLGGQPDGAVAVEIENPLNPEQRLVVWQGTRSDPLAAMRNARQIDECQYLAGRHWQKAYEAAEIGGARAIDYTRDKVDGGQIAQPTISDTQARAFSDLSKARKALGEYSWTIVFDVLGCHMTVRQCAERRMMRSDTEQRYIGMRFRTSLDEMAIIFNLAS